MKTSLHHQDNFNSNFADEYKRTFNELGSQIERLTGLIVVIFNRFVSIIILIYRNISFSECQSSG